MRGRKHATAIAAMLLFLVSIGSTWAAWSRVAVVKNEFMTAKYGTYISETWEEPENWQPGITQEKIVKVTNEGTIPVAARLTMSQKWVRDPAPEMSTESEAMPADLNSLDQPSLICHTDGVPNGFAAILNFSDEVTVLESARAEDPVLRLNIPSVESIEEAEGKWLLADEDPLETGNYTFYYIGLVEPGEQTPALLESVTMNPLVTTGIAGTSSYYEEDGHGGFILRTETKTNPEGYDGCTYTLDIHMQTVQATSAAVESMYPSFGPDLAIRDYISGYIADTDGGYAADEAPVKTLRIENGPDGVTYEPYRDTDGKGIEDPGYWFMSFTNMVPGGTYTDRLHIENASAGAYRLYMSIVPKEDSELADNEKDLAIRRELLEKIQMDIYYKMDGKDEILLYSGTASGYHYEGSGEKDMYDLVPLGSYGARSKGDIRVDLRLDTSIGLEEDGSYRYSDQLTKVDWQFLVQQITGSGGGGGTAKTGNSGNLSSLPDNMVPVTDWNTLTDKEKENTLIPDNQTPLNSMMPKTGDDTPVTPLIVTVLSLAVFIGCATALRKESEKAKKTR